MTMTEKEQQRKEVERLMQDTITEVPMPFECGGRRFALYQKSLGKVILLNRMRDQLGLDEENLKANTILEVNRICKEKRDVVFRMIALSTKRTQDEVFDEQSNAEIVRLFKENMTDGDMATLLIYILKDDTEAIDKLKGFLRIDREYERKQRISDIRKSSNKNNITVGGVSIYGSLIGYFCERFHWSVSQVMWGISYVNLMMLYFDMSDSIYLSDDELKRLPSRLKFGASDVIDASSPEAQSIIKSMNWS